MCLCVRLCVFIYIYICVCGEAVNGAHVQTLLQGVMDPRGLLPAWCLALTASRHFQKLSTSVDTLSSHQQEQNTDYNQAEMSKRK